MDKAQITIMMARSRSYSATLSQITLAIQQAADDALLHIFYVELGIDGAVIVLIVILAVALRHSAKSILREPPTDK